MYITNLGILSIACKINFSGQNHICACVESIIKFFQKKKKTNYRSKIDNLTEDKGL